MLKLPLSLRTRQPPRPTLFPYTTLFRSLSIRREYFATFQLKGVVPAFLWRRQIAGWNFDFGADVKIDRKSTRLNSSHLGISYAVFCLKKKIRRIPTIS